MKPLTALLAAAILGPLLAATPAWSQGRVAVLIPGAGGAVPNDFLMRNKARIEAAGIATVVATSAGAAASAASAAQQRGAKVVIVGMSRGAPTAAAAIASGAPAAGLVLVSGIYSEAMANLGSPARLPATLVVHHRADQCPITSPESAQQFVRWAGRKASLRWITTKGQDDGKPCRPFGAHGFFTQDGPAVSAIIGFIRSR